MKAGLLKVFAFYQKYSHVVNVALVVLAVAGFALFYRANSANRQQKRESVKKINQLEHDVKDRDKQINADTIALRDARNTLLKLKQEIVIINESNIPHNPNFNQSVVFLSDLIAKIDSIRSARNKD